MFNHNDQKKNGGGEGGSTPFWVIVLDTLSDYYELNYVEFKMTKTLGLNL